MNKSAFIRAVCEKLKEDGKRKPITIPKHSFTISDDEGNTKVFYVKKRDKTMMYSIGDVEAILDACLETVKKAVSTGEEINFHGFGTMNVIKRAPRWTILPTGERVDIAEHSVPKFTAAKDLRMAAKLYDLKIAEEEGFDGNQAESQGGQ